MSYHINFNEAKKIALNEAGVVKAEFTETGIHIAGHHELYELNYTTDYMAYCCYIDAETGEVVGFDYQPIVA